MTIDSLSMEMRALSFSKNPERKRVSSLKEEFGVDSSEIGALEFVERKQNGWEPFLLDVRRSDEEAIATIEGTDLRIMHMEIPDNLEEIPVDRDIVIYCRTGVRSAAVAKFLSESGWSSDRIYNLSGGIHAWSDSVDSTIIKY